MPVPGAAGARPCVADDLVGDRAVRERRVARAAQTGRRVLVSQEDAHQSRRELLLQGARRSSRLRTLLLCLRLPRRRAAHAV